MDIIGVVLTAFGFNFEAQISLRDPNDHNKYVGTDEDWALAEKAIVEACEEKGLPAKVEDVPPRPRLAHAAARHSRFARRPLR